MFKDIYIYQMKLLTRDRVTLFWTFLFPVILGALFHFAFSNLMEAELFEAIPIAVVETDGAADIFAETDLFEITYAKEEAAKQLLESEEVAGYVILGDSPQLVVRDSGYEETVIKSYIDAYDRISSTVEHIMVGSMGTADPQAILDLLEVGEYTKDKEGTNAFPDYTTNFFFTLMAMTCMYAGQAGVRISRIVQANQAATATRISMAPTSRIKMFLGSYTPLLTLQCGISVFVYCYVRYILKVDFGSEHGLLILTGLIGTVTGVSFGAMIGILLKTSEGVKNGCVLAISMVGSFLAGMMSTDMKYIVQQNAPIVGKLNPVNLITDAYYSLYYYDSYERFTGNIVGLLIMCTIFFVLIIFALRRQRYESI